jgi:hypothetical protein
MWLILPLVLAVRRLPYTVRGSSARSSEPNNKARGSCR